MADNYLEKQYEQYQARKAAWEKARKLGKKKKKYSAGTVPPTEENSAQTPLGGKQQD